jgi:hypothetical protein
MSSNSTTTAATANSSLIGFASYQQQNSTADHPASDLISIILFFSIIVALIASFAFYFWFTEWHKIPPQQRREERLEHQKEIDQLVENIRQQVQAVFKIPVVGLLVVLWNSVVHGHRNNTEDLGYSANSSDGMYPRSASAGPPSRHNSTRDRSITPATVSSASGVTSGSFPNSVPLSHEHRKVLAHKFHHLFSIICLILFIVAFIILIGTASAVPSSSTSGFLQASLFVVVLCINMFLVTRQRFYYKERKELFGSDDAHMNAVYKTRFTDWDRKMWSNWIQIVILVIEFFQLLTFPLRDLMTVNSFGAMSESSSSQAQQSNFEYFVSLVLNAGGLMPDMRTPTWYTYTVWTTFAVTCLGLLVAVTVHGVNTWRPYRLPNQWVHWCIPVVVRIASFCYIVIYLRTDYFTLQSLMYIPVLVSVLNRVMFPSIMSKELMTCVRLDHICELSSLPVAECPYSILYQYPTMPCGYYQSTNLLVAISDGLYCSILPHDHLPNQLRAHTTS